MANDTLSKQLRHVSQPMMKFRQFVDVKEALGSSKGTTVWFDKISNISTAGGTLTETNTIPEHQYTLSTGQIVVTEYGNAVPFTGKLDTVSEFSVDNVVTRVLRDDMAKVLDSAAAAQFKETAAKYCALTTTTFALTTDGTFTSTATSNLNAYHVKNCVDQLKTWNVPKYDGDNYICIASIKAIRGLKDDSDWEDAAKYGDPDRLFAGEIGRYYGCRFVEETNYLSNAAGVSSLYGEACFFGADAVMEAVATPEEVRAKIPTDYGRSKGLAWYGICGWKILWEVGDYATEKPHIIWVGSA
jgi:N4-gp56 family major capsid protein